MQSPALALRKRRFKILSDQARSPNPTDHDFSPVAATSERIAPVVVTQWLGTDIGFQVDEQSVHPTRRNHQTAIRML